MSTKRGRRKKNSKLKTEHKSLALTVLFTHSKVIKIIWPVAQLFIGATLHAEVRGDVLHGGIGEDTGTHIHTQINPYTGKMTHWTN